MPSLMSLNVGLPQDIEWQGKIVHTAVWKKPVSGKVMARRLNLDGDGQGDLAGHGGEQRAVMVYQLDSYHHWQINLHLPGSEYGQFGENFTVDGLPDDEVFIGDRYRIGTALFEVSQPRVTCYRVGLRLKCPQLPALLVAQKRPGFYFRVIEEGEVAAGDEITKVLEGPGQVTVAEMDGLLYLPGHPHEALSHAVSIPALSKGWRESFQALLRSDQRGGNAGLAAPSTPPSWTGFHTLRVADVKRESNDVLSFTFEAEDGQPLPAARAGQFVVFRLKSPGDTTAILRSYSLSGPESAGTYRVSIKLASGDGSRYFHERVHTGDLVEVSAPRGSFVLAQNADPVVLLSAGIGATPVLAMLYSLAAASDSSREIWWCHGVRNGEEHPFAAEVEALLSALPHSHRLITYSRPKDEDHLGEHYDVRGRLSRQLLKEHNTPNTANFYLCGSPAFLAELKMAIGACGVPGARIHSEIFSTAPPITPGIASNAPPRAHPPSGAVAVGPTVSFSRSGLAVPWNAKYGSLLEFAEACDVPVRWSCRAGVCHTCESGLIGGQISYTPEPIERPAEGNILICCSTPDSAIELDL